MVIALLLLGGGGVYFTAETVVLPKQEKVWRALLSDLPWGLEADFTDVDFEAAGLRLSIGGATLSDGRGSVLKISEVVAENSLPTALGNLLRFVLGQEEERYDVVRFIGIQPRQRQQGVKLEIQEIRLLDVAIGIDNELPSTIKALTGAINLETAFKAAKIGGYEIHGVKADIQGIFGHLDIMKVHGISKTSLDLVEISGLEVSAGQETLAALEMFRTTNFNIASMMEPALAASGLGAGSSETPTAGDSSALAAFNIFHFADEFVVVGLKVEMPGMAGMSLKRMMYKEEVTRQVPLAGLVPTRTYSEVRDFEFHFPGLAMLSPDIAVFMDATGIKGLELNSQGDDSWDLDVGTYVSSGYSEFTDLMKFSGKVELETFFPEDVIKAMAWSQGMTSVDAATIKPGDIAKAFQSGQDIYGGITLKKLDLLVENNSLIERLFRYGEVAFGMPEADIKAAIDMQLKMAQDDPGLSPSLVDDVAALRTFIRDPRTLRITLRPAEATTISQIMSEGDPDRALDMLGLSLIANEGVEGAAE